MLGILALVGLGVGLTALMLNDDDDDSEAVPSGPRVTTEDDDFVFDQEFRPGISVGLDDLVAEGEITRAEADEILGDIDFVSGTQNLDTRAGDDGVVLLEGNNRIETGEGDDTVLSGAGADNVNLGSGDDVYGTDTRVIHRDDDVQSFPEPDDAIPVGDTLVRGDDLEQGNDTIAGGTGDDAISDNFGRNLINGQQGDDFIISVDDASDQGTADTVRGGVGQDILVVDQGDHVTTGDGADQVVIETYNGVVDGYDLITITDFIAGQDALTVQGNADLLRPAPDGTSPVSLQELEDDGGTLVLINGIPIAHLLGVQGMSPGQIELHIDNQ
ncbi:calcium-binding protein [Ruegeria aquimaris]|uniref:Hemolysin, chromosomal n=1 Tax=Ruegeria aquimaris TaxID=2984333 RepID=A0ABT3ALY2_9RHOB|nr:hypothetical protein [Ruegeria sp. XHP0148]MCV2889648.1 hypothetical protein [Ruegeria sp. XHP0148]